MGNERFRAVAGAEPGEAVPEIGIGMVGYGFMGKAHSNAYRKLPYIFWPAATVPRLVAISGRSEARVAEAARRFGYAGYYTDWADLVADPRVQVVDNVAWHDAHAAPSIAAAEHGKHVLCEKPLALNAAEARRMRDAVVRAGVRHAAAFNYRFAPAIRLAREIVAGSHLGRLSHVRLSYLQDHQADASRPPAKPPSSVLANLGSHLIDLARFLVDEPAAVSGLVRTFNTQRPHPDGSGRMMEIAVDDSVVAHLEFQNGAIGTLECSWIASGRKNQLTLELDGDRGSLAWDLEDLNRLSVYLAHRDKIEGVRGFEDVLVTEATHPYVQHWWPRGHILGWEHLHANLIHHFLTAVATGAPVEPWCATFEDGYRAAVVGDAIEESSRTGRRVPVTYD